MAPMPPEEVQREIAAYEERQRHNPAEWEKVEGNLRLTKIRRAAPIDKYYNHHFNAGHEEK